MAATAGTLLLAALLGRWRACEAISRVGLSTGASEALRWKSAPMILPQGGGLRVFADGSYEALLYTPPPTATAALPLLIYLRGIEGTNQVSIRDLADIQDMVGSPLHVLRMGTAPSVLAQQFVVAVPNYQQQMQPDGIRDFLDFLLSKSAGLNIDPTKVFITGHSGGGASALAAAMKKPHRFAAVVPVAACYDRGDPKDLLGVRLWAFHGVADTFIPPYCSMGLVKDLKKAGQPEAEALLTVYNKSVTAPPVPLDCSFHRGHGICSTTYTQPDLYDWLLQREPAALQLRLSGHKVAVAEEKKAMLA